MGAFIEPYEPGSVLKPFFVATLLAARKARMEEQVDGEGGTWTDPNGRVHRDVHAYDMLTLRDALRVSSNIGMVKFAPRLSPGQQFGYLRDFGFGTPTGVEYPTESSGRLPRPDRWSKPTPASLATGYEVSVTPLQLALAYGALANGGSLMEPRLVREVRAPGGRTLERREPREVRRVVPRSVATQIRDVLVSVVEDGTATRASLSTFEVAGKTGTARRTGANGRYEAGAYNATFVGFFPARDPQLTILVRLDRPQGRLLRRIDGGARHARDAAGHPGRAHAGAGPPRPAGHAPAVAGAARRAGRGARRPAAVRGGGGVRVREHGRAAQGGGAPAGGRGPRAGRERAAAAGRGAKAARPGGERPRAGERARTHHAPSGGRIGGARRHDGDRRRRKMTKRHTTLGAIEARLAREELLAGDRRLSLGHSIREVWDVTADSRKVRVGALFCAWKGTSSDGHEYLPAAFEAGATGVVVETCTDAIPTPQLCVTDGRVGAAYAAAEFFSDPWAEMTLVGVTGTNGKTTTAAMLRHLLSLDGPAGYIGTLGAIGADGAVVPGTEGLTTPGPVEAARWLRTFLDDGVARVAMEVSSHALDQARMAAARFDAAVFTNLTRDHLDYHGTMESYREAKLRLLHLLKSTGAAVVNADDPEWRDVASPVGRTLRFGVERAGEADVAAEDVRVGAGGMEFTLRTPDGGEPVALPVFGDFNVSNAVASAAVLWSLGWDTKRIAEALGTLPQVPGRLERIAGPPGSATVLRDYAHTPDALERALKAVRPLVSGRLIVVFGAGGDRDAGQAAGDGVHRGPVLGPGHRHLRQPADGGSRADHRRDRTRHGGCTSPAAFRPARGHPYRTHRGTPGRPGAPGRQGPRDLPDRRGGKTSVR